MAVYTKGRGEDWFFDRAKQGWGFEVSRNSDNELISLISRAGLFRFTCDMVHRFAASNIGMKGLGLAVRLSVS